MRQLPILTTALIVFGASTLFGQATTPAKDRAPAADTRARAKAAATDTDVSYGRIKELTPGQKVVIDVDNAVDKTFDLSDKDLSVKLAKGLKVGDPVKVNEHEVAGKTKSVTITKHAGGGVAHGDKDPAAKKP
jgi:hypothetical protein